MEELDHHSLEKPRPFDASRRVEAIAFEERAFAALSYVWILFLVPLVLKRDNLFILFHLKQGIIVFVAELLVAILLWVLSSILTTLFPIAGFQLMQWLYRLAFIFFVVVSLWAIVQTFRGRRFRLPWFYRFAALVKL